MSFFYLPQYQLKALNVPGGINAVQTSGIILDTVTGLDISKGGIVALDWTNPIDTSKIEYVSFTSISGSNELAGVIRGAEGVSAKSHNNGVTAAFIVSKSHVNNLNDAMLNLVTSAGVVDTTKIVDLTTAQSLSRKININTNSYTPTAAGTATLDLSYTRHVITMPAGNITIALSSATTNQPFVVEILQDSVGSRTVTWFSTIRWAGGVAPTLTTTLSKKDTFGFICTGTGTYDGYVVGQNV